jgi:uncharacterized protein YpuA (DUF1002 family)
MKAWVVYQQDLIKEKGEDHKEDNMAKIVQVITRPEQEYNLQVAEAQVRDLDAIVEKLNSTYQEELKEEIEAFNLFIN